MLHTITANVIQCQFLQSDSWHQATYDSQPLDLQVDQGVQSLV